MTRAEQEQAIAHDLEACDIALAFAKGRARTRFIKHRKACIAQIAAWNKEDGLPEMTIDEIFAELSA